MSKNIEVEGGEIAIQNESGDIAIIPIKDVSRVKKMLKNPSELDEYVSSLPKMSEYAEDGTILSNDNNVEHKLESFISDLSTSYWAGEIIKWIKSKIDLAVDDSWFDYDIDMVHKSYDNGKFKN